MFSLYNPSQITKSRLNIKGHQSKLTLNKTFSTTDWETVNDKGFGDVANNGIFHFAVYCGYLYAATYKNSAGGELWRTQVGDNQSDWEQCNIDGFGNSSNTMMSALLDYNGYLYVGTSNATGAELWRSINGTDWIQVNSTGFNNPNNTMVQSFCIYLGYLYIALYNSVTGMQLWRTLNGVDYEQIISDGFGNSNNKGAGPQNCMKVFNGHLYIAAYNNTEGVGDGGEIFRTSDGINFTQVCDAGFGSQYTRGVQSFGVYRGYLYGCTNSASDHKVNVWRTRVGSQQSDWEKVTDDGLGVSADDSFGLYVYNDWLYLATTRANVYECRVWRTQVGEQQSDWEQCNEPAFGVGVWGYECADFIEFKGKLYGAGMPGNNDLGAYVFRLDTGQNLNETGSIVAQGLSIQPIHIEHGNISGVNNLIADHISAQVIGSTGVIFANNAMLSPSTTEVINKNKYFGYIKDSDGNYILRKQNYYWDGGAYQATIGWFVGNSAGQNNIGNNSNGFGYSALRSNTGSYSNGFGHYALYSNTGSNSNGFGHAALYSNTGSNSNGFGHYALRYNTGSNSNGFGYSALYSNTGVNSNGFGHYALETNTGVNSNGFGYFALRSNTGVNSNGFGYYALRSNIGNSSNGFGYYALYSNTGSSCNGFGHAVLRYNTGSSSNGFGYYALETNTGNNSNGFGYYALRSNIGVSCNGFGYSALYSNTGSNCNGFGYYALETNAGVDSNGFGYYALRSNTGNSSNGFGHSALYSNTGSNSNGFGHYALYSNTGNNCNGFGYYALRSNIGNSSNGFGYYALRSNTGNSSNGFGHAALYSNTGNSSNGFGHAALQYNTGVNSNGFGYYALESNTGVNSNGFGYYALRSNTGNSSSGFGYYALRSNTGVNSNGFGYQNLYYNNWPDRIEIGYQTNKNFDPDSSTDQAFVDTDITTDTITFASAHGFGTTGNNVNLKYTLVSGVDPNGLVDGTIYQFTITSSTVLTLSGISSAGVGSYKLTKDYDLSRSITFGKDAFATKADQVILGPTTNTETLLRGSTGIDTTPDASAILHASSITKGFLPPVMTTVQKGAVSSPATGLIVFDSDLAKICVYTGSAWETVTSA